MHPDALADRLVFLDRDGLPRPDWGSIADEIERIDDELARGEAWTAAAWNWLSTLADALPQRSTLAEAPNSIALMPDGFTARSAAVLSDLCRRDLLRRPTNNEPNWCGRGTPCSYELAEVLVRTLFQDFRPRWFGLNRSRPPRLLAFLSTANESDAGDSAAHEHLGFGVEELAQRFLGTATR